MLAAIYITAEPWIPDDFKLLSVVSDRSNLTKYLFVLYFLPELSWDWVGYELSDRSDIYKAFFYLSRLLSCAIGAISSLDFLHKITSKNIPIISSVQVVAILSTIGVIYFALKLTNARAGRAVVNRVSDPSSRLILFDGCFQFLFAIGLLFFTGDLPSLFAATNKVGRLDLLLSRLVAGSSLGLSIFNFASVGLPEDEANILITARKVQYTFTCAFMFAMSAANWFSPLHTAIVALYICQLVHILLPAANAEIADK
ncbi:Oidioi.mRNA.OKI2018_I69.XSR.g16214.t1.cds [Oikopleura dioica]|uniref:Oidioi.mRNA.OKI2018_I69.XSR.g16214.t1.cds n=1 Tax=Oikopleura dioica TaxID=34765 RepID=A0ABN7SFW7_OIKDI|nr:Oidioi.mRNA.OKI2018_I69.XSR.g16214.t1.cds [Oikopleura dioica]